MKTNSQQRRRTSFVAMVFFLWVLAVFFQLFKVQVLGYTTYAEKIRAQTLRVMDLHSKRGTITDRNGEILAISISAKSAFLQNKDAALTSDVFRTVCGRISLSPAERQRIDLRISDGERFIWVKRKLPDDEYQALAAWPFSEKERGILNFVTEYHRVYPQRKIASHILGGVGIDEQPLGGIELTLDATIRGRGGKIRTLMDARKRVFNLKYIEEPVSGKNVVLTIDAVLQFMVERELERVVTAHRAKGGAVVILDSRDGSVLAMASCPDYYPEQIGLALPEARRNRAISYLYDPGSTFKVVLAASALANRTSYPQQLFNCYEGRYALYDRVITDVHPYSQLSFQDIIIHSSNIGAARIGERLGSSRLYATVTDFGFGQKTGIDLPGEENGILNPLPRWTAVSLAFISHGYEISVTPLQMARAFNVLASGGLLRKPEILGPGTRELFPPSHSKRILARSTVQQLSTILGRVVEQGTGTKAGIPGLSIAGKTGTTQKVKEGRYSSDHISSFGGFFPADDSRVTIFVMVDEPQGEFYGGDVAAPLFHDIVQKILAYLGIYPGVAAQGEVLS